MAFTHIQLGQTSTPGQRVKTCVLGIQNSVTALTTEIATMATMVDGGDPSQAVNFGEVVSRYGVEGPTLDDQKASAKALWDELNSLNFKLTTNASVTDVNSAINQASNKIR